MPAQMNFWGGNVIDTTAPLQKAFTNVGSMLEASRLEDIRKQQLAQQAAEAKALQGYRDKQLIMQQAADDRITLGNKELNTYSKALGNYAQDVVPEAQGLSIAAAYNKAIASGMAPEQASTIAQQGVDKALLAYNKSPEQQIGVLQTVGISPGNYDPSKLLQARKDAISVIEDREKDRLTNAHRSATLDLQRQGYKDKKGLLQGEVAGSLLPVEESIMKDVTKTVPTANSGAILQAAYDDMTKTIGSANKKEQGRGYEEYLKANDPIAYKKYTERKGLVEKAYDTSKENLMRGPMLALSGAKWVKDALAPKSQADIDNAIDVPVKKGVMTRAEWVAENAKYDTQAKAAVRDFLKTDKGIQKELGAIEDKVTKSAVRVDENTIKKNMYDTIRTYAQENKLPMDDFKILGMMKSASNKVDKILANRAEADKIQIQHMYDNLDTQAKQAFDLQVIQMKDKLGRVPTPKEEVDMKLQALKSEELKQKIDDAKGWW